MIRQALTLVLLSVLVLIEVGYLTSPAACEAMHYNVPCGTGSLGDRITLINTNPWPMIWNIPIFGLAAGILTVFANKEKNPETRSAQRTF